MVQLLYLNYQDVSEACYKGLSEDWTNILLGKCIDFRDGIEKIHPKITPKKTLKKACPSVVVGLFF